jgi:hypothetical protein
MSFNSEFEMSLGFENFINMIFDKKNIAILKELKGLFGIPDYMLVQSSADSIEHVISIELKLRDWKGALKQAFRYKSFSNESFVVLDESNINLGLKNIKSFKHYNIGLGSFNSNDEFRIHFFPLLSEPFSTNFDKKIAQSLSGSNVECLLSDAYKDYVSCFNDEVLVSEFSTYSV